MDRISALRNVEEALSEFEEGELALSELESQVEAVLRTYATEFETDDLAAYRVEGERETAVVVAGSPGEARERAGDLRGLSPLAVERVDTPGKRSPQE